MANTLSTGSPRLGKKGSAKFVVLDQGSAEEMPVASLATNSRHGSSGVVTPLQSDKLSNVSAKSAAPDFKQDARAHSGSQEATAVQAILARITTLKLDQLQDEKKKSLDQVLAAMKTHNENEAEQNVDSGQGMKIAGDRSTGSDPYTATTDSFQMVKANTDADEVARVKQELAAAKSVISRQEQELAESRQVQYPADQSIVSTQNQLTANAAPPFNQPWMQAPGKYLPHDDSRSDNSDGLPMNDYNRGRGIWNGGPNQTNFPGNMASLNNQNQSDLMGPRNIRGAWPPTIGMPTGQGMIPNNQRVLSGPAVPSMGFEGRFNEDQSQFNMGVGRRTASHMNRSNAGVNNFGLNNAGMNNQGYNQRTAPYGGNVAPFGGLAPSSINPPGFGGQLATQQRPIGTPLSPTAMEFNGTSLSGSSRPFSSLSNVSGQTYFSPVEPMNYRSLLDKTVSCDWKYIVDKIVCSNDQQASIFLQQKLKVGNAEQKFEIIEAIVNQAYPLMINRFGNFLVQRCFEHGTPDQVVAISNAIHGNVLSLSTDAFGCHVIQKAFDSVPENHKADMVRELLRRIPDTVIHRYACHVWQKLFELRWSGEPPQIMVKVNDALRGMWHEVALGETGSLVVQNIFENCVEEEKRPAIEEVISNINLISHGQFGNWCIQHLCEHGSPPDKRRVIDHILDNAYNYSIDQFASKVVEKCLKIGGTEFMDRYLAVVTTAHPDRPRIPLIDISGDQYGNYLVQWILMNSHHHQREQVAGYIRKHMVSLRGSKFGSRVAMLCCNPASITRPGPGVIVNPFGVPGQPRGGAWGRYR